MPKVPTIAANLLFTECTLSKHDKCFLLYFRDRGGRKRGPFTVLQIIDMIKAARLARTRRVKRSQSR